MPNNLAADIISMQLVLIRQDLRSITYRKLLFRQQQVVSTARRKRNPAVTVSPSYSPLFAGRLFIDPQDRSVSNCHRAVHCCKRRLHRHARASWERVSGRKT